jgi:DNA-binding MarR family transcriptional regulator
MSIRQIGECFYTPTLAPNERLVAIALADFADDHGRAWPSLKTIAEKTGYSRRQTQRIVHQLQEKGYVEIIIEANWNRTPLYQLHPENLKTREAPTEAPLPFHEDAQEALDRRGDKMTPPDTGDTPGDDTGDQEGMTPTTRGDDTGDTQTVIEPSDEPPPEPSVAPLPAIVEGEEHIERFTDATVSRETPRPRNPGWDALTDVFGYDPEETGERTLWGRLAARANAEPDPDAAVKERARRIIAQWGVGKLTPASLNKWWQRFGTPLGAATDQDAEAMREAHEREQRRQRMGAAQLEEGT